VERADDRQLISGIMADRLAHEGRCCRGGEKAARPRPGGTESWSVLNSALGETRATFDRANQAAREAFKRATTALKFADRRRPTPGMKAKRLVGLIVLVLAVRLATHSLPLSNICLRS
jgi:hypothetical protein